MKLRNRTAQPRDVIDRYRGVTAVALLMVTGVFLAPLVAGDAPFSTNVRVDDGGANGAYAPAVTAKSFGANGTVFAAFEDDRSGSSDIRFAKSTDNGLTWAPSVRVHEALTSTQTTPAIAIDAAATLYVAWEDDRAGAYDFDIYLSRSTDQGVTWSSSVKVSDGAAGLDERDVSLAGGVSGTIHVAYRDLDIRFTTSSNGGATFLPSVRVNDDTGGADQTSPSLALGTTGLYLAWDDMRKGGDIFTSRSTDGGATWGANRQANSGASSPVLSEPILVVGGPGVDSLYLAFSSEADIRFTKSTDLGQTWASSVAVTDSTAAGFQYRPSLVKEPADGKLQVAWEDWRIPGQQEIFASRTFDAGNTWEKNRRVNDDSGATDQRAPAAALLNDDFHVLFSDGRNGDSDIYAARRAPAGQPLLPNHAARRAPAGQPLLPNLVVASADITVAPGFGSSYVGTAQTLSALVRNTGNYQVVNSFAVGFYKGDMDANNDGIIDAGAVLLKSTTVAASWANPIPAGGSRTATASWTPSAGDVGTFTIWVAVDLQASGPFHDGDVEEVNNAQSMIVDNQAFYDTGAYPSGPEPPYRTATAPNYRVHNALTDVVANGKFQTNTVLWTFTALGKNKPTGSWDPAGYQNGGASKIASPVGSKRTGEGYYEQTLGTGIQAGSIVKLSYDWKKGMAGIAPQVQDLRIVLVKPGGTTVDLDVQLGAPGAYNTWYLVTDKTVSSHFDQTGTYKLRLRYVYTTGSTNNAQALAWFDEVRLLVSAP